METYKIQAYTNNTDHITITVRAKNEITLIKRCRKHLKEYCAKGSSLMYKMSTDVRVMDKDGRRGNYCSANKKIFWN